jgi:hypothetical protein
MDNMSKIEKYEQSTYPITQTFELKKNSIIV